MSRIKAFLAAIALVVAPALAPVLAPATAQAASPAIEAAKANGKVGERADGYLGFVAEQVDQSLVAEVEETNIQRRAEYTRLAQEQGLSVEAVAAVTAEKLIGRLPAGQWYKNVNNQWVQK